MKRNGTRAGIRFGWAVGLPLAGLVLAAGLPGGLAGVSARAADLGPPPAPAQTALDRYIAKADPSFDWALVKTLPGQGYKTYILKMHSQTWRGKAEVDRPVWEHWVTIVEPDKIDHAETSFLNIGGGDNKGDAPGAAPDRLSQLALDSGTVTAEVGQVPNQPLYFTDTPKAGRVEDDLVAYSRVKFMKTGDEEWPVRLAMVKSAVRAMDAVQQFLKSPEHKAAAGRSLEPASFVVSGASKRGWTTWLTGVEDPRVVAIIPLVIDALNSQAITRHHYQAYGFFSRALEDYFKHGIFPDKIGTPEYEKALNIEDPYVYRNRERMKIPKFMINAAGDEFFLPDNAQFYYADMPEEKRIRYAPNCKHNMAGSDVRESLTAFYMSVLNKTPRPEYSWKMEPDGSIAARCMENPLEVKLWHATNPNARDFRLDQIGKAWTSEPLAQANVDVEDDDDRLYVGRVRVPTKGYTAYFVEFTFDSGGKYPFKFTTPVRVSPDKLPFEFPKPGEPAKLEEIKKEK